jgi:shikimate kinase
LRTRNHAGGLEGGITNGEPLVLRAVMKPISTVPAALPSVHLGTLQAVPAHVERSDTCAVPAAGVVCEAMLSLALADAVLEALGGDTLASLRTGFARLRVSARTALGQVFLVGPMGAGKTTVGGRLSRLLGLPFVDLDAQLEARTGASVAQLFAQEGEERFRRREADALAELETGSPAVVALGGGTPCTEEAWRRMRRCGVVVALEAEAKELLRRLAAAPGGIAARPLLHGGEPEAQLGELLRGRQRWYARADATLRTDGLSPDSAAGAVVGLLRALEGPLVRLSAEP